MVPHKSVRNEHFDCLYSIFFAGKCSILSSDQHDAVELSYAKSKWQQKLLVEEKQVSDATSMLPAQIIERLDEGSAVEPELFESVTVIFGQVCNFTQFTKF